MFFMSGDSTKEWDKYLFSGSSGWSIRKAPAPLKSVPVTFTSPSKNPAQPTAGVDAVPNKAVPVAVEAKTPKPAASPASTAALLGSALVVWTRVPVNPLLLTDRPVDAAPATTLAGPEIVVPLVLSIFSRDAPSMKLMDPLEATLLIRYSCVTLLKPWNCASAPNWS